MTYLYKTCPRLCPKGALPGLRQVLATECLLKMINMFFISPQKLLSFSRYLNFCLDFLSCIEKA